MHQESHKTLSIITNNSTSEITIELYKNGLKENHKGHNLPELQVNQNESIIVLTDAQEGIGRGNIYPENINYTWDSLIVSYNSNHKKTHYSQKIDANFSNQISFSHHRNLFNQKNWEEKIVSQSKRRVERNFTFTFTEQDYLDAQK